MIIWQELCILGDGLTSLVLATAKGQEKHQLIMTIFFGNFLLWEFTVSKGAKVFIFSIWLLFWHYLVLNTWNHLYNGRRSRVCAGGLWNRSSPSPQVSCQISEQIFIFIFLAQSKHMQRGGKQPLLLHSTTECSNIKTSFSLLLCCP